jgi:hypothetical protein
MAAHDGIIRQDDYYGGSVTVAWFCNEDWGYRDELEIVWEAWGGHGETRIRLTATEARALAVALDSLLMVGAPNG